MMSSAFLQDWKHENKMQSTLPKRPAKQLLQSAATTCHQHSTLREGTTQQRYPAGRRLSSRMPELSKLIHVHMISKHTSKVSRHRIDC
jgi:hypothetical protein